MISGNTQVYLIKLQSKKTSIFLFLIAAEGLSSNICLNNPKATGLILIE